MQLTSLKKPKLLACFFILILTSLILFSPAGVAESREEIEVTYPEEGKIRVRTEITEYTFTEQGGALRSIFIYFSPFRSKQVEVVPGTSIDPGSRELSYMDGIRFPGELDIRGESDRDLNYDINFPEGRDNHYDKLPITFVKKKGDIKVEKTYTIYNNQNYTVGLSLSVVNESDEEVELGEEITLYLASQVTSDGDDDVEYLTNPSTKFLLNGNVTSYPGSNERFDGFGLVGDDLVLFLKTGTPEQDFGAGGAEVSPKVAEGELKLNFPETTLAGGETKEFQFSLYGGRRRHVLLSNVGLEEIDDIGIFSRLLVPVIGFLNLLYDFTGNYGWAIILFTVLIRVVLYPLMRNMYRSMAKMQELQPKIKKIQDEYEDKEEQQKKMMALYKEEGVNPLGGCLPMFIQLPILILLWRAIMYSAEAIHMSPGFLWLSDLSMRDPTYILVILTVGTMILQQQMMQTPGGGGSQNKIMSYGFPLFMGVFLRNFPAGLWLYYLLTQLFMIGQQAFINWEMEKEES